MSLIVPEYGLIIWMVISAVVVGGVGFAIVKWLTKQ